MNIRQLNDRAKDLSRTNLLFIFGIIKAASIGLAVTIFLQLFIDLGPIWKWEAIWRQLPFFMLWLASYLCLLVTFDVAMFATIFLVHIPKKSETFFTFLLVGTETLQFAILSPEISKSTCSKTIMSVRIEDWWYAIFCCYCIFILLLLIFGKKEISCNLKHISQELRPLIKRYMKSFDKVLIVLAISFLTSIVAFVMSAFFIDYILNYHFWFHMLTSTIIVSSIALSFILQHQQRTEIERALSNFTEMTEE